MTPGQRVRRDPAAMTPAASNADPPSQSVHEPASPARASAAHPKATDPARATINLTFTRATVLQIRIDSVRECA